MPCSVSHPDTACGLGCYSTLRAAASSDSITSMPWGFCWSHTRASISKCLSLFYTGWNKQPLLVMVKAGFNVVLKGVKRDLGLSYNFAKCLSPSRNGCSDRKCSYALNLFSLKKYCCIYLDVSNTVCMFFPRNTQCIQACSLLYIHIWENTAFK